MWPNFSVTLREVHVDGIILRLLLYSLLSGVNSAWVMGVRTPPIFDLQESTSALDPCNNCYIITIGGRGGKKKGEDPLNILSVLTPSRFVQSPSNK